MASNRKAIDRELMYQKIMPSITKSSSSTPEQNTVIPSPAIITPEVQEHTTTDIFTKPIEPKNIKSTVLVNIVESIVIERVDSAMDRFNCCHCDRCKKDIIALTLNKVPPKYMVFDENRMTEVVAKQTTADVTAALVQSIIKVKAAPRH